MFLEILLDHESMESIKAKHKVRLFGEFKDAMAKLLKGDSKPIEKFANRIRRGGKSGKCKHLKEVYPHLTDNFIFCLPLKRITRQQKMAELIIPISAVNEGNYRRVDELAVFDQLESQFRKFFSRESGVKAQRRQIAEDIEEDEVMVRIETATNKQFSHFAGRPDFV